MFTKSTSKGNPNSHKRLVYICGALQFLAVLQSGLVAVPRLRLLEASICSDYHEAHDPVLDALPEMACKSSEVQVSLALLTGWKAFFDLLPGLVLGIPFVALSERVGRRLVLKANVLSSILSQLLILFICYNHKVISLKFVWAATLFDVAGGGAMVFDAIIQSTITENVPKDSLTKTFFYLAASLSVTRMIGVIAGSVVLTWSLWLPLILGPFILLPSFIIISQVPDRAPSATDIALHDEQALCSGTNALPSNGAFNDTEDEDRYAESVIQNSLSHHLARLLFTEKIRAYSSHASKYWIIFLVFFIHELAMGIRDITQQWMSKQYSWPLQITGYILASQTLVGSIVLLLLPPAIRKVHYLRSLPLLEQDSNIACGSLLAAIFGTLGIAWSGTNRWSFVIFLYIYALGVGFFDAMKSLASKIVPERDLAMLYLGISYVKALANMSNGPVWASFYAFAMEFGDAGMMLPFLVSSLLIFGTLALVLSMKSSL